MKSTAWGIAANLALAVTKGAAGVLGNSYALIADAIESTADIFTSVVVWGGLKIASRPPDKDHPYGHGKAETLAATAVSVALIAAALFIAVQSIREIQTPHHAPALFTLPVLLGVILVKETLFRFVFRVGDEVGSAAVKSDAWHHRSDALTSTAAFFGISIALVGGKGYEMADDYAALLASCVIAFNGIRLLVPALHELMDRAPSPHFEDEVRRIASGVEGVVALDKCLIRKAGFEYFVDLHVQVDGRITVQEGHWIGHQVKDMLRESDSRIADVLVHIEPAGSHPA